MPTLVSLFAVQLLATTGPASVQTIEVADAAAPIPGLVWTRDLALAAQAASAQAGPTIPQRPGFPITIGAHPNFAPWRSGVIEDLDLDGVNEIIVASTDAKVYAFHADGTAVAGFPVTTTGLAQTAPSVGDIDGDGDLEIVQLTRGITSGGRLYVIDHTGAVLPGFPLSVNNGNLEGSATLADLDDDGALEILVPERAFPIGRLHVFELDGSEWAGNWPVALDHVPTGSSAVADVDGDGSLEIAYLSYASAWLLRADGTSLPGWPKAIAGANFSYQSPALADLDQDGDLEVVLGAHQNAAGYHVFHHDGTAVAGWPQLVGTWTYVPPTVVDLDGDGVLEILGGREGSGVPPSAALFAWTNAGVPLAGFPYQSSQAGAVGGCGGAIVVTDADGDGARDVLSDANVSVGGQGFVYGVDANGQDLPGFPLRPSGFTYQNGPTIGDVDGDGDLELLVISYTLPTAHINLYDLPASFSPAASAWRAYHQDVTRGGRSGGGRELFSRAAFQIGTSPELSIVGIPGELASVGLSLGSGSSQVFGDWWHLGALVRRPIANVVVPASGLVTAPFTLPNNPNLIGTKFYFQGLLRVGSIGRTTNVFARVVH